MSENPESSQGAGFSAFWDSLGAADYGIYRAYDERD
jgi:hypothetical protein